MEPGGTPPGSAGDGGCAELVRRRTFSGRGASGTDELRVELLETDGLPQMDGFMDQNDVYALIVFEDRRTG